MTETFRRGQLVHVTACVGSDRVVQQFARVTEVEGAHVSVECQDGTECTVRRDRVVAAF